MPENSEKKMKVIRDSVFDEERALYHLTDAWVEKCAFAGAADGESAFKEARNIHVLDCAFQLRYPLWHVKDFTLDTCRFSETSRAALWYDENGTIVSCTLNGVKALRECRNIRLSGVEADSEEFGWRCDGITAENCGLRSNYIFMDSKNITLRNIRMTGKYSFQYTENMEITDSVLDTKDAFWHSRNVTVKNCTVRGEYLGWYSENLKLIDCAIIGTQPLCYCKGLKMQNCTMENCDLAFEYSQIEADVKGTIDSVKNPESGMIVCDGVGEIIMRDAVYPCDGKVVIRR